MATLALEHVVKIYPGNVRAVDDFTLDVADGQLIVLVGPSGCGKTTTLRMIAGLEPVTGGTISIGGRNMGGVSPANRDVAMVFQNYALYPHMTVAGNMAFGLKLRRLGREEIRRRVREAAEMLSIGKLLARRPDELSGGQRQRVALGRAIVREPKLFLLDEPLANLDAALRAQMRREIHRLQQRLATTMVYVTHDQTEAMTLGGRIVVIRQGRIQQVADPATLYNRPDNLFVAGLIGSPAMNFFHGRIQCRDGRLLFDAGSFTLPVPAARTTQLEGYTGRPIILGIRPEHIASPAAEQTPDAPRIPAVVEAVEPVGAESYVHLSSATHTFVARADADHSFHVGRRAEPAVAVDQVHFFDPQTERAVPQEV